MQLFPWLLNGMLDTYFSKIGLNLNWNFSYFYILFLYLFPQVTSGQKEGICKKKTIKSVNTFQLCLNISCLSVTFKLHLVTTYNGLLIFISSRWQHYSSLLIFLIVQMVNFSWFVFLCYAETIME